MTDKLPGETTLPDMPEPDDTDALSGIPEELRFDLDERPGADDRPEEDRLPFALGGRRVVATRPKEYTMLALASAMSSMADNSDIAYAVMLFCHDSFDGPTRNLVSRMDPDKLYDLIQKLCDHWGQDTSNWRKENRAARRAKKTGSRRR
jgi:hypothetical protein